MINNNVHIILSATKKYWMIIFKGDCVSIHTFKFNARRDARRLAKFYESKLVIHRSDGRITKVVNYENI